MTVEIGAVFKRPHDRLWLPRLREWMTANRPKFDKLGVKARVMQFSTLDGLLDWRAERPNEHLAVTFGFGRGEIEAHRAFRPGFGRASGEPVVVAASAAMNSNDPATASFMIRDRAIACSDVTLQVRKSLIRAALRSRIDIRIPSSDEELAQYFALRYRVWKKAGYLREENRQVCPSGRSIFGDRTAVPLCAIARDGKVIGCVRVISSHGDEEATYVSRIERLLAQVKSSKLSALFKFPHVVRQPFDLLEEFPEFRPHFRALIRSRANMAEIGRVAVDPDHRGQFLSEALVDTAVSCAQAKGVARLFLACHDKVAPLYAKCGFEPVAGLRSDKFFNIQLISIVMERRLQSASSRIAA